MGRRSRVRRLPTVLLLSGAAALTAGCGRGDEATVEDKLRGRDVVGLFTVQEAACVSSPAEDGTYLCAVRGEGPGRELGTCAIDARRTTIGRCEPG